MSGVHPLGPTSLAAGTQPATRGTVDGLTFEHLLPDNLKLARGGLNQRRSEVDLCAADDVQVAVLVDVQHPAQNLQWSGVCDLLAVQWLHGVGNFPRPGVKQLREPLPCVFEFRLLRSDREVD